MNKFFVEQAKKPKGIKSQFKKITQKGKKIIININLKNKKIEKKMKIAKKIKRILIREKCKQIVVEKAIKEDIEFMNILYGYNINICDSKWLFKQLTNEIIEEILKNKNKEESEIHICINEIDNQSEEYIYRFAKEFKRINIITNHIGKFKKIEKCLFEEDGILINITNNKRKSLAKAELILNIDFPKEIINQFTIYDKAIIITWENDTKILKKRFNGKIVNDYSYTINQDNEVTKLIKEFNLIGYDERDLCQMLEIVPKGILEINN